MLVFYYGEKGKKGLENKGRFYWKKHETNPLEIGRTEEPEDLVNPRLL